MTTQISGDTGVSAVQDGAVNPATDIAYNQMWQNVLASRAFATNYVNSTGQPITVAVSLNSTLNVNVTILVGGVVVAESNTQLNAGFGASAQAVIPAGATYQVNQVGTGAITLTKWMELR